MVQVTVRGSAAVQPSGDETNVKPSGNGSVTMTLCRGCVRHVRHRERVRNLRAGRDHRGARRLLERDLGLDVVVGDGARRALTQGQRDQRTVLDAADTRERRRHVLGGAALGHFVGARQHLGVRHFGVAGRAGDGLGTGRGQRPVFRHGRPAVVIHHFFDQGELRGDVVVDDRARRRLPNASRPNVVGLRPTHTRPRGGRVPDRPGLRQVIGARADRRARHRRVARRARSRPRSGRSRSTSTPSPPRCRRRRSRPASPTSTSPGCRH